VERNSMNNLLARRAVVIGGGIGGLSVAGALAGYFEEVDVLERDRLPASAESRPGTPQDRHPHLLLAGGSKALGEIFPGFKRNLAEAGAVSVKMAQEVRLERPDVGALPSRDLGMSALICASRPLIESVLRRRVMALANVALRPKCRVTEIVGDAGAVRGVRFASASEQSKTLDADLVVDASGRGALTLALLDALGWEQPTLTEVGVDLTYATTVVPIPEHKPEWKLAVSMPNPPTSALQAGVVPMEGDRWIASIADRRGPARIETWDNFLAALSRMITPTLYQALRHAEPTNVFRHHVFSTSQWRHFERLPRLPRGLLPIGDAICRFNPIHGQGMSSAAKQARLLQIALEAAAASEDPIAAAQAAFMADVESVLRTPWNMSTGADLAFPEIRGERPENFEESRKFEAALFRAAVADPIVHRALMEVSQLLQPHDLLHEPHIMERIETYSAKAEAAA
jgi:2-polyprenyl-6-methoxyphenol hydroxylase-like FAD-dependent oxidoreductase